MDQSIAHTRASLYDIFYATKAKRTYTNLGVSLLLIILFLVFALIPTITTIGTVQQKIEAYKTLNSSLKAKIDSARRLDAQLNNSSSESSNGLKDEIDFMNKVYMTNYDLKPLYVNLYNRAQASNTRILSISPKYPASEFGTTIVDNYKSAPTTQGYEISLSMVANDIRSANAFVKSLEGYQEMPIILRVNSFALNDINSALKLNPVTNNSQSSTNGVTFTVSLIIYTDQTRSEN